MFFFIHVVDCERFSTFVSNYMWTYPTASESDIDFFNFENVKDTFEDVKFQFNPTETSITSSEPLFTYTFEGSNEVPQSHKKTNMVHSIKAFTKLCELSTPTIMKWLDGHKVYKSSSAKIQRALNKSNISKEDLINMRRLVRKQKSWIGKSMYFRDDPRKPKELEGFVTKSKERSIEFVVGHKITPIVTETNSKFDYLYQVVYNDLSTGWVNADEVIDPNEAKLVVDYWEWHETKNPKNATNLVL